MACPFCSIVHEETSTTQWSFRGIDRKCRRLLVTANFCSWPSVLFWRTETCPWASFAWIQSLWREYHPCSQLSRCCCRLFWTVIRPMLRQSSSEGGTSYPPKASVILTRTHSVKTSTSCWWRMASWSSLGRYRHASHLYSRPGCCLLILVNLGLSSWPLSSWSAAYS